MTAAVTELARHNGGASTRGLAMPVQTVQLAVKRREEMVSFVQQIMVKNIDYGVVPGTDKPTLMKPGAEKLCTFFGLSLRPTIVDKVEDWTGENHGGEPLFYYLYRYSVLKDGDLIAEADGSCNSRESKYRWRFVRESDLPPGANKDKLQRRGGTAREAEFALRKRETGGKWGKPEAYWKKFEDAIAAGTAKRCKIPKKDGGEMPGWEIEDTLYKVPNEDAPSLLNTIQKMAQKRALVGAVLLAVNASEFFTQDLDDMVPEHQAPPADDVQDAEYTTAPPDPFPSDFAVAVMKRGFAAETAAEFLTRLTAHRKTTVAGLNDKSRATLLAQATDGSFDAWLRGIEAPGGPPDAEQGAGGPEAQDAEPAGELPATPAPASAEPSEHEKRLIAAQELAESKGLDPVAFKRAMDKVYVRYGVKGAEHTLPAAAWDEVMKAIATRAGYFA
jgi:hypothetical protein